MFEKHPISKNRWMLKQKSCHEIWKTSNQNFQTKNKSNCRFDMFDPAPKVFFFVCASSDFSWGRPHNIPSVLPSLQAKIRPYNGYDSAEGV